MRALLLLLVAAASALHAQHRESVTVEVVNVPVYVHRGDAPVTGLTRERFELLVNGKPVPVEYFDVIGDQAATGDAPGLAPAAMRERRLFLLIFDIAFSRPGLIDRGRQAAIQLVRDAKPGDYFAIATFAPNRGMQILVPFTDDTAAVQMAIRGAAASDDPLRLVVPRTTRTAMMAEVPGETAVEYPTDAATKSTKAEDEGALRDGAGNIIPQPGETRAQTNERIRRLRLEQQRPVIEEQLSSLAALATRLGALEGQKHVVLLSEGFDMSSLDDPRRQVGATKDLTAPYIAKLFEDMAKHFHGTGVFLHTLDVSGLALQGRVRRQEGLQLLASHTGGDYLHDRNDFRAALSDITTTYGRGYLLGFRPSDAKSGYNTISVRVKGERGVKVRHRVGFESAAPPANPTDALHLADIVLNDVPQTGVPAALMLREGRLQARIPMDQVSAVLGKAGRAELMVYVFDAKGAALHFQRQVLDVPAAATGVYPVNFVLGLEPGQYTVKALLRAGESLGLSRVKLNVTAPAS
jgi:VWFA-related protein